MPIASAVLRCHLGDAPRVATRVAQAALGDLVRVQGDAVLLVFEAPDRKQLRARFESLGAFEGVRWVDAAYYNEEDLHDGE